MAAFAIHSLAFCDDTSRKRNAVVAQQDDYPIGIPETCPENVLFGELGGNGLSLTVNYERLFSERFGLRVGYGPYFENPIPLMFNYYTGTKYQLELGIGIVLLPRWKTNSISYAARGPLLLSSTIGFKFDAPPCGGFFFKVSLTPFFNPNETRGRLIGGFSLGTTF